MAAAAALAGLQLAGAYNESVAMAEQAKNEELAAQLNANVLRTNAELTEKAGMEEESAFRKKVRKFLGEQKAALAANGVDVGYGSAKDVLIESELAGEIDAIKIRSNASLEAFGLKSQASQMELQGRVKGQGLRNAAQNTLLGGVLNAGVTSYQGLGKITVPKDGLENTSGTRRSGKYYNTSGE